MNRIFGLFVIFSAFGVALNLLWAIGVRDVTLLGILSGLVLVGALRLVDRPPG
jgi:hypothetical protein